MKQQSSVPFTNTHKQSTTMLQLTELSKLRRRRSDAMLRPLFFTVLCVPASSPPVQSV